MSEENDGSHILRPAGGARPASSALCPDRPPFQGRQKAGPTDARRHNRALILQNLYPRRRLSRADLARATALTRVTVSEVVADLIREGLVLEVGQTRDARPGKPATLLRLDAESRNVVAVDLSQPAALRGALTNLLGQIVFRDEVPYDVSEQRLDPAVVVGLCRRLVARAGAPVLGIGIASPGIVDRSGQVLAAPNLGWTEVPLALLVRRETEVETRVDNDANSAALAERQFGEGAANMLFIHIARGLGSGVLVDDRLVLGAACAAGEIGHVVVDPGGAPCSCGKRGCLETKIAVPVLQEALRRDPDRLDEVLTTAGGTLGSALSMPIGMLDIPEVVLYGPASVVNETFVRATEAALNARTAASFRTPVTVRRSHLGDDIVLVGAGAAVVRAAIAAV